MLLSLALILYFLLFCHILLYLIFCPGMQQASHSKNTVKSIRFHTKIVHILHLSDMNIKESKVKLRVHEAPNSVCCSRKHDDSFDNWQHLLITTATCVFSRTSFKMIFSFLYKITSSLQSHRVKVHFDGKYSVILHNLWLPPLKKDLSNSWNTNLQTGLQY